MKTMNKLFDKLWWLSDQEEPMNEFVNAIKSYCDYMGGDVLIGLIDLYNFGFQQGHIYIAYDDCSGCSNPSIWEASKFIEYYKEVLNQYPELHPEGFWNEKLTKIIEY